MRVTFNPIADRCTVGVAPTHHLTQTQARASHLSHTETLAARIAALEHANKALQADKDAEVNALRATMRKMEQERAAESRQLNGKIEKLRAVQTAALAAGSVRGRALLYAEQLKLRQQALREGPSNLPDEAENVPPGEE